MSTPKQLKKRWLTPEGKKVRQQIIEHIREHNWERFLKGFPYVEEVENGKDLRFIDIGRTSLEGADFHSADLNGANLEGAYLKKTDLNMANLMDANMNEVNLEKAYLWGATFLNTNLMKANLKKAQLTRAILIKANLTEANLEGANLSGAELGAANLEKSNLCNTNLVYCSLNNVNLHGASMINCSIYGISAWDIITDDETIMKGLVINKDPLITVDDIEIAQFIHLILNNKKISNIITSMRTKCVLILGSFDDDSMPVLNKLTEILPEYNLVPIIFYFKAPKEHSLMETVRTMALLSKFVIVDLSKRSGQLYEIANLVNNIKVPYVTIAVEGTKVSGILEDLHDYYWYKKEYFPYPEKGWNEKLPVLVKDEIIHWADEINNKLLENKDGKD